MVKNVNHAVIIFTNKQTSEKPARMGNQLKKMIILAANSENIGEAIDNCFGISSLAVVAVDVFGQPHSSIC